MKKSFLIALLVLATGFSVNAQKFSLGGEAPTLGISGGLSVSTFMLTNLDGVTAQPLFGFYGTLYAKESIIDSTLYFIGGFGISTRGASLETKIGDVTTQQDINMLSFEVPVFMEYFITKDISVSGGILLSAITDETKNEYKLDRFNYYGGLGFSYYLNDNIAIPVRAFYGFPKIDNNQEHFRNAGFQVGVSFEL